MTSKTANAALCAFGGGVRDCEHLCRKLNPVISPNPPSIQPPTTECAAAVLAATDFNTSDGHQNVGNAVEVSARDAASVLFQYGRSTEPCDAEKQ
jgi:hypothetical protein